MPKVFLSGRFVKRNLFPCFMAITIFFSVSGAALTGSVSGGLMMPDHPQVNYATHPHPE